MYDYIIIGQGLAGTILSYSLTKRGLKVFVINDESKIAASNASAGIFNPITGKRMTKTWKAELLFPFLKIYYSELETYLQEKLVHMMPVYKPFSGIFEQNEWLGKASEQNYAEFINTNVPDSKYDRFLNSDFGGFETRQSGYINVSLMLEKYRAILIKKNLYLNEKANIDTLNWNDNSVAINNISAKKIIFCEGSYAGENKHFKWLPFTPLKGQVMKIKIEENTANAIFNKNGFVVPIMDNSCIIGSTYERRFQDDSPTQEGRQQLEEKIRAFYKPDFKVTEHKAGIRPAVSDRRPVIGIHPELETLAIFNGLGTKGVSLAPFFAESFCDHLLNEKDLDPEVDIFRFRSLYSRVV